MNDNDPLLLCLSDDDTNSEVCDTDSEKSCKADTNRSFSEEGFYYHPDDFPSADISDANTAADIAVSDSEPEDFSLLCMNLNAQPPSGTENHNMHLCGLNSSSKSTNILDVDIPSNGDSEPEMVSTDNHLSDQELLRSIKHKVSASNHGNLAHTFTKDKFEILWDALNSFYTECCGR